MLERQISLSSALPPDLLATSPCQVVPHIGADCQVAPVGFLVRMRCVVKGGRIFFNVLGVLSCILSPEDACRWFSKILRLADGQWESLSPGNFHIQLFSLMLQHGSLLTHSPIASVCEHTLREAPMNDECSLNPEVHRLLQV